MFNNPFVFDDKKFTDKTTLATYLKNNFRKSLLVIEDNSLLNFLEVERNDLYLKIVDLSKEFECKENILTLAIYFSINSKLGSPSSYTGNNIFSRDILLSFISPLYFA